MKVKIFFFVLLFVASLSLNAQDKEWFCSVPGDPLLQESHGYVNSLSHQTQNYLCWSGNGSVTDLNVFDGSKWRKIKMNDTIWSMSISIDEQNDSFIMVSGEFKYDYVWLYNGVQWQRINKLKFLRNNTHYITAIKFYRNKIYVALQIDSVNASLLEYDFKLNTTKTVSTFQRKAIKTVHEIPLLMELSVRNNRLYISGAYDSANHQNSQGYGYYDGSSFKSLNIFPSFPSNFSIVKQLDKSIFVVERIYDITSNDISNYRMFFIRNDSVIGDISRDLYTKHFKKPTYGTLLHGDFQVYLQNGFIHIFDDFKNQHFAFDLTNRRWHAEKVLFSEAKSFLFKNNRYVFNSEATLPYPTKSLGCFILKPTAFVSGYAFADIDDNCVKTSNDFSMSKQWIKMEGVNSTTATMSNNDGFYGMTLDPGNYTFKSSEPTFSTSICSTGTLKVDTFAQYNLDVSHNFIAPYSTTGDIKVELFGSFLRRGMKYNLTIVLDNIGKPESTVAPRLNFDHRLQFVSSSTAYLSKDHHSIVFDNVKVKKFKPVKIDLVFYLPPDSLAVRNTIRFTASADSSNSEISYANNIKIYDATVIGPYDPNHIAANVEGAVKNSPKEIVYTVEFQNLGTDTAFNVTIIDTIPKALDIYSIKLLSASSEDIYATIKGSVVSFKFNQVRLTPKVFDDAKSKGFISFSIELKDTLKIEDILKNKAGIYFDYEAVVTTNQSKVERVRYGLSVKSSELKNKIPFTSYPNPSAKQLSIQTIEGKAIESIKFISITGQELFAESSNGIDFDISTWSNGLFLIVVKIDGQTYTSLNSKLVH